MAGVSSRYLRKIAVETVPPPVADGPDVQYLLATNAGNAWRVHVDEVDRFMEAATRAESWRPTTWRCEPRSRPACCTPQVSSSSETMSPVPSRPGGPSRAWSSCHQEAVYDVVGFLERPAAFVRGPEARSRPPGSPPRCGTTGRRATGLPLLHSRITIVNAAVGIDGRRSALDGTALYAWAGASGHVYQVCGPSRPHAHLREVTVLSLIGAGFYVAGSLAPTRHPS
jgi:hypothetical protein